MGLGKYISAGASRTRGLYHLEGDSNDTSGNAHNGADTNITYQLKNKALGKAAVFGAFTLGHILVGDNLDFQFGGTTPFTVRALTLFNSSWGIIMSNHNANVLGGWSATKHAAPTSRITLQRTDFPNYNQAEKEFDPNPGYEKRMHCVFVYNPVAQTVQVFANGEPGVALASLSQESNNNEAFIGAQKINNIINNQFRGGWLDEVVAEPRAWNKRYIDRDYAQSIGRTAPMIM